MAANYNDNTNFANFNGQGSVNAVRSWLASESSIAISVRGLFLCLGYWYALVLKLACRPRRRRSWRRVGRRPTAATSAISAGCRASSSTPAQSALPDWKWPPCG